MCEFKDSVRKRLPLLEKHFNVCVTFKTWLQFPTGYGEDIHFLSKKV